MIAHKSVTCCSWVYWHLPPTANSSPIVESLFKRDRYVRFPQENPVLFGRKSAVIGTSKIILRRVRDESSREEVYL